MGGSREDEDEVEVDMGQAESNYMLGLASFVCQIDPS